MKHLFKRRQKIKPVRGKFICCALKVYILQTCLTKTMQAQVKPQMHQSVYLNKLKLRKNAIALNQQP